ncbi:uncharacterized protein LOC144612198 [Rhinoraja longicauda]
MRFVNCARKKEEQNLVAFQHWGNIYYRTCKPVPPHCELLVWYGDDYAKELGITWTTMWMSNQDPKLCEACETFFIEECPVHGPPILMKDTVIDCNRRDRAHFTLPEGLSIATSKIRKADLGVWNEGKVIPRGIYFGPYGGEVSNEEEAAISGYSWAISKANNDTEYIDAQDESKSNWMRFVNCARKEEEQNLVACGQHLLQDLQAGSSSLRVAGLQKAHTCRETCPVCGNVFKDTAAFTVHLRACVERFHFIPVRFLEVVITKMLTLEFATFEVLFEV